MSRIDVRLTALESELNLFLELLKALEKKDLVQIISTSGFYKNRNAQTFRCYVELNMNFSHSDMGE